MACKDDDYEPVAISGSDYILVRTKEYDPLDGDNYPPRNKGHSVADWLHGDYEPKPDDDDIIALVDPDQIFIGHLDTSAVKRGYRFV